VADCPKQGEDWEAKPGFAGAPFFFFFFFLRTCLGNNDHLAVFGRLAASFRVIVCNSLFIDRMR